MSLALSGLMSGASNISCSCSMSSMMRSTSMRHNHLREGAERSNGRALVFRERFVRCQSFCRRPVTGSQNRFFKGVAPHVVLVTACARSGVSDEKIFLFVARLRGCRITPQFASSRVVITTVQVVRIKCDSVESVATLPLRNEQTAVVLSCLRWWATLK